MRFFLAIVALFLIAGCFEREELHYPEPSSLSVQKEIKQAICNPGCQIVLEKGVEQKIIYNGLPASMKLKNTEKADIQIIVQQESVYEIRAAGTGQKGVVPLNTEPLFYEIKEVNSSSVVLEISEMPLPKEITNPDIQHILEPEQSMQITPEEIDHKKETQKFQKWAGLHRIELKGTSKTSNELYNNGSDGSDFVPLSEVNNANEAAEGLYLLPDRILKAMDGKTIYLSTRQGRGYTVLSSWPESNILKGMERGIILEQTITRQQAVHEFGHILDFHGIRGMYDDEQNLWSDLEEQRKELFNVAFKRDPSINDLPEGYLDLYSTANDAENFAQHFAAYVLEGEKFRKLAENDTLLRTKYDFFKEKLFEDKEY